MSAGVRTALTVLMAALIGAGGGILAVLWLQGSGESETTRPAFSLEMLDDGPRSIEEWDGEVIVLNFWATWCAPCREEIPLFSRLDQAFSARGVQFLGVAIDDPEAIRGFLANVEMGYPSFYGMESAIDVAADYGNPRGTLPYTVVIDRDGTIVERFSGQIHEPDLRPVLNDLTDTQG
ncbi:MULTISPECIES: TlpA family protein disulfide reductase [Spiribacter]|jgi:thiol-disulfide isomerase/thioredoxin|uniref:TlpA family protein disulfide reductase n=2 Tax=Spiribacter TaxID=1335745 RepID=A0A557RMN5_9GAMM|nr:MULTISPECIES: TlpA disulfide reductase family protein [Spiribacter]AUB79255.1 redoxin [Spiribacter roseus]KAF0279449.1 redoxin [Spiribacter roseus]KAF0281830.1 redoxin [Spiribacter roseus]KAF0283858.1 redoxin [Spiribacter roseus]KAF0284954.1 redoxin [Spiribacter sp. SSL99]